MFCNVHGPYSSGLPDYFELRIVEPGSDGFDFYPKWGLPYAGVPMYQRGRRRR